MQKIIINRPNLIFIIDNLDKIWGLFVIGS